MKRKFERRKMPKCTQTMRISWDASVHFGACSTTPPTTCCDICAQIPQLGEEHRLIGQQSFKEHELSMESEQEQIFPSLRLLGRRGHAGRVMGGARPSRMVGRARATDRELICLPRTGCLPKAQTINMCRFAEKLNTNHGLYNGGQ